MAPDQPSHDTNTCVMMDSSAFKYLFKCSAIAQYYNISVRNVNLSYVLKTPHVCNYMQTACPLDKINANTYSHSHLCTHKYRCSSICITAMQFACKDYVFCVFNVGWLVVHPLGIHGIAMRKLTFDIDFPCNIITSGSNKGVSPCTLLYHIAL